MRKTLETELTINGEPCVLTVQQLDAVTALSVLSTLLKKMGPVYAQVKSGNDKAALISLVGEAFDPVEFEALAKKVLSSATLAFPGRSEVENSLAKRLGEVFAGDVLSLFEAVVFAIGVNFENFSERLAQVLGKLTETTGTK